MTSSFRRRVAFSETDASGRVHFSQFLKWAEDAEHQLLKTLGIPVLSEEGGWPRVKVQCEYLQAVGFDEELEIELSLSEMGKSSLRWAFRILKDGGQVAARGEMVTVFVSGGKASPFPELTSTALRNLL
ncbi:MAG: acyl-CoA thioesterase [Roseibacillus sp.]